MTKCCPKTCILSFVAVFAFLFGYDFLVHGVLMKADYEATAALWRSEAEMQQMFVWCLVYHAALAAVLTCFFKKFRACNCGPNCQCSPEAATSCCPIKSGGLCFGLKVGLILGLSHATFYISLPIPGELAIKWFFASLFQGIGAGVILGMICRQKSCDAGVK